MQTIINKVVNQWKYFLELKINHQLQVNIFITLTETFFD